MLAHLYQILQLRAERFPSAIALGAEEGLRWRTLDSRQLLEHVDGLAADLAERGVGNGDRVVLWAPSGLRTPTYLFALWKLGAIVVPFDRETNPQAATAILAAVEPRCVILGFDQRPSWAPADAVEWWQPTPRPSPQPANWQSPAEPLAAIFFTSGTTGQPKGCMISHQNLCSQVEAFDDRIPIDEDCRLGSILPLSHLFELSCGLTYPLLRGAAIHYIPSRRGSDVVRVLLEQRITHMVAVPQLLSLMGNALEQRLQSRLPPWLYQNLVKLADRSPMALRRRLFFMVHRQIGGSLRLLAAGGAALPIETQQIWERLGVDVVQGYGTSEVPIAVACVRRGRDAARQCRLIGINGVQVRPGRRRTASFVCPERRATGGPKAGTAEVLSPDGWYSTGDLASIDGRGNIKLQGRARDLIVLPNGMNVWPQDVEDALRSAATVQDAAVLAVPTPGGGARLHAYLLPLTPANRGGDPNVLLAAVNTRLASHQRVSTASWWPDVDFPRTSTLKAWRRHLAAAAHRSEPGWNGAVAADRRGTPLAEAAAPTRLTLAAVADEQTLGQLGPGCVTGPGRARSSGRRKNRTDATRKRGIHGNDHRRPARSRSESAPGRGTHSRRSGNHATAASSALVL